MFESFAISKQSLRERQQSRNESDNRAITDIHQGFIRAWKKTVASGCVEDRVPIDNSFPYEKALYINNPSNWISVMPNGMHIYDDASAVAWFSKIIQLDGCTKNPHSLLVAALHAKKNWDARWLLKNCEPTEAKFCAAVAGELIGVHSMGYEIAPERRAEAERLKHLWTPMIADAERTLNATLESWRANTAHVLYPENNPKRPHVHPKTFSWDELATRHGRHGWRFEQHRPIRDRLRSLARWALRTPN